MATYPLHIAFSSYAIIGLTLFILSASIAVYLLHLPSKSPATRSLIAFFIMVALSGAAMILANAFFHWDRLFVPWQDFWVLAAGLALTYFAYNLPKAERSSESRIVMGAVGALVLLALGYCLVFSIRLLFYWTPGLNVSDAYYLLLPLGTLLVVLVFLRRCVYLSRQDRSSSDGQVAENVWGHLAHPRGNDAEAFRSLAMALSLAFLPGLQTLFGFPYPFGFILSNIGSILAIIAVALVYFNFAPEIHSFMAKLVGITLSTVLLIVTVFGAVDIYLAQSHYSADRTKVIASVHDVLVKTGDLPNDPLWVAYAVSWDQANPQDTDSYRELYRADQQAEFDLDALVDDNRDGYLEIWSQPFVGQLARLTDDDWRYVRRYWTYPLGSSYEDYLGYIFVNDGKAYEIGFSTLAAANELSAVVWKWLVLILSASTLVLLIFPMFFRRTLVEPVENLLDGVRRVNHGDMETAISVSFNDEIGILTQSFNRMVRSMNELTHQLENRALILEQKVSARTLELVQGNVQLEKENRDRVKAENLLNQQLLFQKSLAGCSQSLLVAADNDRSQREVFNQALEHLRSGSQTSRAYIFRLFDDSELGLCMGMKAEVCDTGIPAHINNPENLKFPLSKLPIEFTSVIVQGNPYGGLVKQVFASTPELRDAFLSQSPPWLSLMFFPLFLRDQVWGFIGFDDCITEREWDIPEISMLRTASEMIGNTLQRWEIETQLREALDELETRVQERTAALSQSNIKLNEEIGQRQRVQLDLETRLQIEEQLAAISLRLLEPTKIRRNIAASLEDLARIMNAGRIFLAEFDLQTVNQVSEFIEWHRPEMQPISEDVVQSFMISLMGFRDRLRQGETIYIQDNTQDPNDIEFESDFLRERNIQSIVLSPIVIDQRVQAVLGCSNLEATTDTVQMNMRTLDLVSGMLKSLIQREQLIQTLEEQVAERTRQLTTFLDMAMLSDQAQDLADILQPTLHAITQIAACDAVGIHITNEKQSRLELVAQRGIPMDFLGSLEEIEIDAEFAAWLAEAYPYKVSGYPDGDTIFPEPFCLPGFDAYYSNRLRAGDKSIGFLNCYRIADQPFSPFQATLLSALGELLGIVVENHRLRIEAGELAAVEERQRLAREIHDAVSQSVYSLSLFARSANDALDEQNQQKLLANLQDIEATALGAMREMRLLLYQLREAGQEDDIEKALDTRFKQVENRLGIKAVYDIKAEILLPTHIQHQVWRIIVEALNNVVKHAGAAHVHVQISCLDEHLVACIQDDGVGFDIQDYFAGMGLKNMQARAEMLAGDLEVVSTAGQGTQISLKIPLACIDPEEGD